ncbi:MAG: hypothetical protein KDK70_08905, partial [Myxococcales bacterium]|nr:hypothetical protein [Myxococcales bacterium]
DRVTVERLARVYASQGLLSQTLRLLERLSALIEAQADRGELRAMLQKAASWCSDTSYQQALELLGLRALRPGGAVRLDPPVTRPLPRRRQHAAVPPPLPRALRRRPRVRSESGEIHVLDDLELLDEDDPTAGGPADGPSDGPTVETAPPPPTACAVAP